MPSKILLRSAGFLLLLFIVLYVGMSNTARIKFSLPLILKDRINAPGAYIFFGMFALGVIAGTLLHRGRGR